ncbi:uncharacterized protein LOC119574857 [Penaeus monodon]|uniref:uncharacterized protein LOC119574857 n=1 Tax=Penaeus monodon TaxID=6687 RepID=UPI0018A6DB61|nr:uncharacterized protein LOC119574857 [Penaeus monodon]
MHENKMTSQSGPGKVGLPIEANLRRLEGEQYESILREAIVSRDKLRGHPSIQHYRTGAIARVERDPVGFHSTSLDCIRQRVLERAEDHACSIYLEMPRRLPHRIRDVGTVCRHGIQCCM